MLKKIKQLINKLDWFHIFSFVLIAASSFIVFIIIKSVFIWAFF